MQDLSTGQMIPVDSERFANDRESQQRAKDAAIPIRENQGPVFGIGETLEIRGGKFRVHAIAGKRIYLDSLASK